ncbi:hypothetical protein A2U01_0068386, partial [Trifolium medium]|nr:hypothetical protein [Trifolium medium]
WTAAVELWFEGQGREDHLFIQYKNISLPRINKVGNMLMLPSNPISFV